MRKLIFILIALISFSQAQTIQYIGAPTTTVISRGNFRTDSIFYLPKRTKLPTDTAAFRYQISDSSLYYWTGYQWTKVQSASSFASVDTLVISTRAYRQKGIDSVQYNVGLKLNISDTSTMLSPYIRHAGYGLTKSSQALSVDTGLMATRLRVGKAVDSLGAIISTKGSGTVTSVATGYGLSGGTITTTGTLIADTLNLSTRAWRQKGLDSLAALEISGSGTTNYVPKFTNTREIGNSLMQDNGTIVEIGTGIKWDNTNKRLLVQRGSGISTPAKLFTLSSDLSTTELAFYNFTNNASNRNWSLASNFATFGDFAILQSSTQTGDPYAFGNEKLYIAQDGNIIINSRTDAGAYTLQNNGALYNTGSAILAANGTSHAGVGTLPSAWSWPNTIMQFRFGGHIAVADNSFMQIGANSYYDGSNYVRVNAGYASRYLQNDGGHFWASATTSTAGSTVTFSENMRLTRDAELLVGTTTDAGNYRVQVSGATYISEDISIRGTYSPVSATNRGNITLNGTASNIIAFANNSALRGYIFHTDSDFLFYNNTTGGRVGLYTEGTARLWITANGGTGIGTTSPSASALLDLSSTTRGFLPPRMTSTERDAISSPAAGLVIYNTTTSKLQVYTTSWTDLH